MHPRPTQVLVLFVILLLAFAVSAQQPSTEGKPMNSSKIAPDGTAYVTRIVPVPSTVSPEAQQYLARPESDAPVHQTLEQRRSGTDQWQNATGAEFQKLYPVTVTTGTIAGVPVRIITPNNPSPANQHRVLINLHGGGFNSDSGSLTESIPVSYFSGVKVIAVLYRLAPEHPFPAAVEDVLAVYQELLKTNQPSSIGIFGTSAGAILTSEVTVKLKQSHLPLPAVTGIFSGLGDFSKPSDSMALYALNGFSGYLAPPDPHRHDAEYVANTDPKDPVLSPAYADLTGFPPTLFITSGRDLLLSGTILLHRAYLHAGVDARLIVFEALPHAFWNNPALPESKEAHQFMATFLADHLAK